MRDTLITIGAIIAIGLIIFGITFGERLLDANADRMVFKQSTVYNEGVVDDLAKYKFEMQSAKDDAEKQAICELVNSRFANFDESKLENDDLKRFLKDCRNGELN